MKVMRREYTDLVIPEIKKVTGKICHIGDLTLINGDLDADIHKGFTVGNGKQMYWMMIWHQSGHVTVFTADENEPLRKRWLDGDTEITIHFK